MELTEAPATRSPNVLVVDDEKNILNTVGICLESIGMHPILTTRPQEVAGLIADHAIDVAFVDLKMVPMDGIEVLHEIKRLSPATAVIIMTAHGTIDSAVKAVKNGAYHYIQKPFDFEELKLLAQQVWEHRRLVEEVETLRREVAGLSGRGEILTRNRGMLEQLEIAARVADSPLSVLVEGESGTGKELLAEYIHRRSGRSDRPLVKVNCAALPEQLLESELFGHARGAFTGAVKDRQGRFEMADGGTIFLDEVAELSPAIQAKLLRVLQQKEFERIGENQTRKVDVRVIAATNRNIDEALREGSFREDLFYRLNGVRIKLLPLRERPEDIPLLVQHLLERTAKGRAITVAPAAEQTLRSYRWSGNIRELENVIARAALLATTGVVELQDLPEEIRSVEATPPHSLEEMEKAHIKRVLQYAKDYDDAARILGIDRKTLLNKRKKFGL
jgi:NtrC-family two-component system response regulator AlgB